LLKKLLALRIIAVTPHEIVRFAAWLGFHADEIESSNMDSVVQWKKKRRRIVSTGAKSTEKGHEESSLGQRGETERHIRMLVANRPAGRAKAVSSGERHMMILQRY